MTTEEKDEYLIIINKFFPCQKSLKENKSYSDVPNTEISQVFRALAIYAMGQRGNMVKDTNNSNTISFRANVSAQDEMDKSQKNFEFILNSSQSATIILKNVYKQLDQTITVNADINGKKITYSGLENSQYLTDIVELLPPPFIKHTNKL